MRGLVYIWILIFDKNISFKKSQQQIANRQLIGIGWYTYLYILYYSCVRFLLDFIRIDKPEYFAGLGINQLILLAVTVYSGVQLKMIYAKKEEK